MDFVESITPFFLHCTHFSNQRLNLINKIKDIDIRISNKNDPLITQILDLERFYSLQSNLKSLIETTK